MVRRQSSRFLELVSRVGPPPTAVATLIAIALAGPENRVLTRPPFRPRHLQDKWTPVQIKKMQLGGNAKAREFFEASEGYGGKAMPIADKVSISSRAHFDI